ncbi:MAG: outer membrane protein assembly factor BamD [Thiomicrorhabdus sp.]|nr:MAG: outer membrane protein assembly factor BamD [Thiomicrorhabdus sp.]
MKKTLLSALLITTFSLQGCSTLSALAPKLDSEKTVDEFYDVATTAFEEQRWDAAIASYEKLKSFYPYGDYAEQSYLELAYAYYKYDEDESAIIELDEFIRLFPKHPSIAYAYYLKALAADSVNQSWLDKFITDPASRDSTATVRAFRYYSDVLNKFPQSEFASKASQRLIILRNQMARHELQVAQFYFKRQAYLAAVNRGRYILENYPRSSVTLDTLTMLEMAYGKLKMPEVMADIRSVHDLNSTTEETSPIAESTDTPPAQKSNKSWWQSITEFFEGVSK